MAKAGNNDKETVRKTSGGNTRPKKDPQGLHSGHRDRLKKRFLETGLDGFNEHQIVELLLFYAYPRVDTNDKAHELINKFGSIPGILNASYDELIKDGLLTESAAALIKLILGIIPIYCDTRSAGIEYNSSQKLIGLFEPQFIGLDREELHLACFDPQLRLISNTVISKGGMTTSAVDMRKLMEAVFASKAPCIAIAHNHPGASPEPSSEDIFFTRNLCTIMRSMDIKFLDHVIVGENGSVSIRDTEGSPFDE